MPSIYLSPSTQELNQYVTGGSEEQHMNVLADALVPYLRASGIRYTRNTPEMTAASSIEASNAGNYDFHLALHSNAAPEGQSGTVRGSQAYYYPGSPRGQRAANLFVSNLKAIYPDPNNVRAIPTTTLGEVRRTRAPAVLLEVAYHDNPEDAQWIIENTQGIARNIALSLTEYFGLPFQTPKAPKTGTVTLSSGYLNIRDYPTTQSAVLARAYNGATLQVLGQAGDFYVVEFGNIVGFANANYITV
ncbi:MAG: N-acetylmuramoyl-L-alanine amidase [Oscillospiraceae bacterium]|jgi:hypothetical protein